MCRCGRGPSVDYGYQEQAVNEERGDDVYLEMVVSVEIREQLLLQRFNVLPLIPHTTNSPFDPTQHGG